jgi:hypothetical protein
MAKQIAGLSPVQCSQSHLQDGIATSILECQPCRVCAPLICGTTTLPISPMPILARPVYRTAAQGHDLWKSGLPADSAISSKAIRVRSLWALSHAVDTKARMCKTASVDYAIVLSGEGVVMMGETCEGR